mmetsp:Transcript_20209/g.63529  ORF Transcript_20209/g.63529 Transcript_20209/m.63529 type:complete len:118 (+) Transcript_20209:48-401(+)
MFRVLVALFFSAVAVSAFAPQPQAASQVYTVARASGYIPDGLSPAEWAKKQKEEEAKKKANKAKYPKGKVGVPIAAWLSDLEKRQTLAGEKIVGSGHTFAKTKFSTKEEYDAAKGKK